LISSSVNDGEAGLCGLSPSFIQKMKELSPSFIQKMKELSPSFIQIGYICLKMNTVNV